MTSELNGAAVFTVGKQRQSFTTATDTEDDVAPQRMGDFTGAAF